MLKMTLGQFAVAVGAPKRWVQNAYAALRLPAGYDETRARRLAFARTVKQACGMSFGRAYQLAEGALATWPAEKVWTHRGPDGAVAVSVELERFLSDFAARISLARTYYAERRRGRPRRRRGLALAKWYGVDVSLLESALRLTPMQRLQRLEQAVQFIRAARRRT